MNRNWFSRLVPQFMRPTEGGTVSDGSVPGAEVGLFEEQAVTQLVKMLTKMPDVDEVLKQAGVKRDRLRVLLYDDEIAQACETRQDALIATPWRLEPSEGKPAQMLKEILEPVVRDAMRGSWKARLFGYSVLEAVYYRREDKAIGLQFLGDKPFHWFEPRTTGELRYYPDDGSGGAYGLIVDQRYKFFLTRCNPSYEQPYGEALLSRLYWPWFFRTQGWKFWAKFLERFGAPLLVGKSGDPKSMVAALLMAHSQAVMGIDKEDSVEAIGVPAGNTGQAFDTFEAAVIRRIQKVVLGQTLTSGTDNGSGNRALGQVHDSVRQDKRNSDIQLVTPVMQKIVDALCELNGWPKHEFVLADDTGLESARATRDKDLYTVGVRFKDTYMQDNYDLRAEDFEMSSAEPVAGTTPAEPQSGGGANPGGGQTGDANATPNSGSGASAARSPSPLLLSHAAGTRFTKQQQIVEDQADAALAAAGSPIDPAKVRQAVLAATDPEDLADRLFAILGDQVSAAQFNSVLEQALFAADVLGYVHSEGKV